MSCSSSVQSNWSRAEGLVLAGGLFALAVAADAPGSWPLANVWSTFTPLFLVVVFFSLLKVVFVMLHHIREGVTSLQPLVATVLDTL